MTWYVIILGQEGKIFDTCEIDKSLKETLELLIKTREKLFLLFEDKRKAFISVIRGHLEKIQKSFREYKRIQYKIVPDYFSLSPESCDLLVSCASLEDPTCTIFWLDLPGRGALLINTASIPSNTTIFGFPAKTRSGIKGLYEKFENVFNMEDLHKVLYSESIIY